MTDGSDKETSLIDTVFSIGAIGIILWFLIVASEGLDSNVSPIYIAIFFVPVGGLFLLAYLIVKFLNSILSSGNNN